MKGDNLLEAIDEAHIAIEAASDKQASDIVLLDVRNNCNFADYFVISSGESSPQLQAIADETEARLKRIGVKPLHVEGGTHSGWILLDFGSVVVHIFSPDERRYYSLERLWDIATPIVHIQ